MELVQKAENMRQSRINKINKSSLDNILSRSSSGRYSDATSSSSSMMDRNSASKYSRYYKYSPSSSYSSSYKQSSAQKSTVYSILDSKPASRQRSRVITSKVTKKKSSPSLRAKPPVITSGLRRSPRLQARYANSSSIKNDYSSLNNYSSYKSRYLSDDDFLKQYQSTLNKYSPAASTRHQSSISSRSSSNRKTKSSSRKSNILYHPYY